MRSVLTNPATSSPSSYCAGTDGSRPPPRSGSAAPDSFWRLTMNRRSFAALLTSTVLCSAPLAAQDSSLAAPGTFVLRAARMIDGTGAAEVQNAAIVVVGDSITWVGSASNVKAPAGSRTIDLGDATLLPGFIDAHVHLAGRELGDPQADEAAE